MRASIRANTRWGASRRRGFLDATTDAAIITRWWTQAPEANIGVWAGGSGLVIIDIDNHLVGAHPAGAHPAGAHPAGAHPDAEGAHLADGFATWLALQASHPGIECETVSALTGGGGRHLFFAAPPGCKLPGKLGPGVDVKANGGYVVVPPSRHASGKPYAFEKDRNPVRMRPAQLPPALLELLNPKTENCGAAGTKQASLPEHPPINPSPQEATAPSERVGDEYARSHTWADILEPHGWQLARQQGQHGLLDPAGQGRRGERSHGRRQRRRVVGVEHERRAIPTGRKLHQVCGVCAAGAWGRLQSGGAQPARSAGAGRSGRCRHPLPRSGRYGWSRR